MFRPGCLFTLFDHKPVSDAADVLDVGRFFGVILHLLAETVDIDHDGIVIDKGISPYEVVEHVLGEDGVHIVHKELHEHVLFSGERDLSSVLIEAERRGVIGERPGRDVRVFLGGTAGAPAYFDFSEFEKSKMAFTNIMP